MTSVNAPDKCEIVEVNSIPFTFQEMNNVVKAFYAKVAVDDHLHGPFSMVDDWPHHIERLTHFWWIRFGGRPYMDVQYDPIGKHLESGFNEGLLEIWLDLFKEVLNETLSVPQALLWSEFAGRIGVALNRNNEMMIRHMRSK